VTVAGVVGRSPSHAPRALAREEPLDCSLGHVRGAGAANETDRFERRCASDGVRAVPPALQPPSAGRLPSRQTTVRLVESHTGVRRLGAGSEPAAWSARPVAGPGIE
jgi:hypothetical protein